MEKTFCVRVNVQAKVSRLTYTTNLPFHARMTKATAEEEEE